MDSSVKRAAALILEDRVYDLESQLASANRALNTKEQVVRLQQEQLRKLELKYKQCLDGAASATCSHKKTLNDLGNLKIILKSYEQRAESNKHFQCQVDLVQIKEPASNEFEKINDVLLVHTVKADQIIELIQNSNAARFDEMESCICDLQSISLNLLETTHKEAELGIPSSSMLRESHDESRDSLNSLPVERSVQTKLELCDSSCNCPEARVSLQTETKVVYASTGSITDSLMRLNKLVTCEEVCNADTHSQTPFFKDVLQLKKQLTQCEVQIEAVDSLVECESELCLHVSSILEHFNANEMELEQFRADLLTLHEKLKEYEVQAQSAEGKTNQVVTVLNRLASVTKELEVSQSIISSLQVQVDSYESQSNSINELRDMYRSIRLEATDFRNEQIYRLRNSYEVEIQMLERQLGEARMQSSSLTSREDCQDASTQVDIQLTEMLRRENEELVERIASLEDQLQLEQSQRISIDELKGLCGRLSLALNDVSAWKKENNLLRRQLAQTFQVGGAHTISRAPKDAKHKNVAQLCSSSSMPLLLDAEEKQGDIQRSNSDSGLNNGTKRPSKKWFLDANQNVYYVTCDVRTNTDTREGVVEEEESSSNCTCTCSDEFNEDVAMSTEKNDQNFVLMMERFLNRLVRQFQETRKCVQVDDDKRRSLKLQNQELLNCLREFRNMNEMLLQSNCELEKAKKYARDEHETLLQEYMALQKRVTVRKMEQASNTPLSVAKCQVGCLEAANLELQSQNLQLRKDLDSLLSQIKDERNEFVQQLNDALAQLSRENEALLQKLEQRDSKITDLQQMCEEEHLFHCKTKEDISILQSFCHQLQTQNDCLQMDANELKAQLKSGRMGHQVLANELEMANNRCKSLQRDLESARTLNIEKINRQDYDKSIQEFLHTISALNDKCTQLEVEKQSAILQLAERDEMLKCSEQAKDSLLECELKSTKELKESIERDFNSFIQTSTMLQQNVDQCNKSLSDEVAALRKENKCQEEQIQALKATHQNHNQELSKSRDECCRYRCKLHDVLHVLDTQRKHVQFQAMDQQKNNLKEVLSGKNKSREVHLNELYAFIEQCETEINEAINRKKCAVDAVNLYYSERSRKCCTIPFCCEVATITANEQGSGRGANFRQKRRSNRSRSLPCRSSGLPLTNKGEPKRAAASLPRAKRH